MRDSGMDSDTNKTPLPHERDHSQQATTISFFPYFAVDSMK